MSDMIFNKKHIAVFIAAFALALFIAGCTQPTPQPPANETVYWPPSQGNNTTSTVSNQSTGAQGTSSLCSSQPNVLLKDDCLVKAAFDSKNSSICSYIYTSEKKDDCLSFFEDGTLAYCGQYSNTSYRNTCMYKVALAGNTTAGCNVIGDSSLRADCISRLAPTCGSQPTAYLVQKCNAFKDSNPALCPDNSCIYDLAKNLSNASICDSIAINESDAVKASCRSYATGADMCSQLSLSVVQDYCYQLLAQKSQNPATCSKASTDYGYQQNCYVNLSILKNDYTICLQNPSSLDKNDCLTQYALATGSADGCSSIDVQAVTATNRCYNVAAQTSKMASLCNNISTYSWRVTCYSGLIQAGRQLDLNDCTQISDHAWNERCISTLAYQQQNSSVCDFIRDTAGVASCKSQFS
ncbi:MAG TPA: hypothetical protein PLO51_03755 [Candidatus Micrarchaeota archaeon]|nr:hypothetical protein [Candidatus Micrarchaeota archaeon]